MYCPLMRHCVSEVTIQKKLTSLCLPDPTLAPSSNRTLRTAGHKPMRNGMARLGGTWLLWQNRHGKPGGPMSPLQIQ